VPCGAEGEGGRQWLAEQVEGGHVVGVEVAPGSMDSHEHGRAAVPP
jgi:hypothetical protein